MLGITALYCRVSTTDQDFARQRYQVSLIAAPQSILIELAASQAIEIHDVFFIHTNGGNG